MGIPFLLLFFAAAAWGQAPPPRAGDGAPPAVESVGEGTPLPHWCEDLGIACTVGGSAATGVGAVLARLKAEDPRRFLPPELARLARLCEAARRRGGDGALPEDTRAASRDYLAAHCGSNGAMARELSELRLIPSDALAGARLPSSGARVVVDCGGRHLQLRGDLPWVQELALLRAALGQFYEIENADALPQRGGSGMSVDATFCELEASEAAGLLLEDSEGGTSPGVRRLLGRLRRRTRTASWNLAYNGSGALYVAIRTTDAEGRDLIPSAYVDESCFAPGGAEAAAGGRGAGDASVAATAARRRVWAFYEWVVETYDRSERVRAGYERCREAALEGRETAERGFDLDGALDAIMDACDFDRHDSLRRLFHERLSEVQAEILEDDGLYAATVEFQRTSTEAYRRGLAALHCGERTHPSYDQEACATYEREHGDSSSEFHLGNMVEAIARRRGHDAQARFGEEGCRDEATPSASCRELRRIITTMESRVTQYRCVVNDECDPFSFATSIRLGY